MKRITKETEYINLSLKAVDMYFGERPFGVFDIETTGLSANFGSIILSGLIRVDCGRAVFHQLFAEVPEEEPRLIEETISLLDTCDYLVTYNGRFFDLPFLTKRAALYELRVPDLYNLDLFPIMKYYSELPHFLRSMSQKSLEAYAGIAQEREDTISGGESIALYRNFCRSASPELEERILLHNADDIRQLYRLMKLLAQSDLHRALSKTGFLFDGGRITSAGIRDRELVIKGVSARPCDYIGFPSEEKPYLIRETGINGKFEICIPLEEHCGALYFDALNILGERAEALEKYPALASGYLIVRDGDRLNSMEINAFALAFLPQALDL